MFKKSARSIFLICSFFMLSGVVPAQGIKVVRSDCNFERPSRTKQNISNFFRKITFRRQVTTCYFGFPIVETLMLDRFYVSLSDVEDNKTIVLKTSAKDPENDPLEYNYEVSDGSILGKGSEVQWDLTNVSSGRYTVLAKANDGSGCGTWIEATVVVED